MKNKTIVLLLVILTIFTLTSVSYAQGIIKVELKLYPAAEPEEQYAGGQATFNFNPKDSDKGIGATIQVQVWGLIPETEYKAIPYYSGAAKTFVTNKSGAANIHLSLQSDHDAQQLWINNIDPDYDNHTVLYCDPIPIIAPL